MKKQEFLTKHNLTDIDYRNLIRFEEVRQSGIYNMHEYLSFMSKNNINGGTKLANWIMEDNNYEEFLETLI